MSIEALLLILLLAFGVAFVLNRVELVRMTQRFRLERTKIKSPAA
jgi:hypothetical protein